MTVLLFVIILGVLVFVHELGHFLVAKFSGIRVDEFAVGFPPRLLSHRVGETRYSLNLIPFGGYVKIHGEDPDLSHPDVAFDKRSFSAKNRLIQVLVLVSGVFANFLFAWFLFASLFMSGATVSSEEYPGTVLRDERVMIVGVVKDSPADKMGLRMGDSIRSVYQEGTLSKVVSIADVQEFVSGSEGREVRLAVEHSGTARDILITPEKTGESDTFVIGVVLDSVGELRLTIFGALREGAKRTYALSVLTVQEIGKFLYRVFTFNADFSSVAGPVGIAKLVGDARNLGWFYLVSFTALISINLGVINLIPFPALDGGRVLFVLIEALVRRPLPPKFVRTAHGVGFVLLMLLLVLVTYRDIIRLF